MIEFHKSFWSRQTVPHHRHDSAEHYAEYAKELKLLLPEKTPKRILELGCGNGALYSFLGFQHATKYVGVDFSQSMVDIFRAAHGDSVELHVHDASAYVDNTQYDLIFSNGVIQYFDQNMLHRSFESCRSMMAPNCRIVHASFPWSALATAYYSGEATFPDQYNLLRGLISRFSRSRRRMGHWHSMHDLSRIARSHGLTARFMGSLNYIYRAHMILEIDH